jgi:hypothetical protein
VPTIQRSTFVTVVAWTIIVLSGLATLVSILWVQPVFFSPEFNQSLQAGPQPFRPFVMHHFRLFFVLYSLVAVSILASSIALLKRRNWARLCFVGLMVVAIAWQIVWLGGQLASLPSMRPQFVELEQMGADDADSLLIASGVLISVFALGMSVLFGWIAKKLTSAPIAAEFRG